MRTEYGFRVLYPRECNMMNTLRIVSLSALFYLASGPALGQQDPDDCSFTWPFVPSPLIMFDAATYRDEPIFGSYRRIFPPVTRVWYLASTVGEESLPCAIWGYADAFYPFYFVGSRTGPTPELRSFNLTIRAYAQSFVPSIFVSPSCRWFGFCVSSGYHAVIAGGPGNPAYYFTVTVPFLGDG